MPHVRLAGGSSPDDEHLYYRPGGKHRPGQGLLAEHGLACWIEYGSQRVLFDTGQGLILANNAYRLKIPLYKADAIVLSHGHYDHTGGLAGPLSRNPQVTVYAHPACVAPKTARTSLGQARDVGIPESAKRAITKRAVSSDSHGRAQTRGGWSDRYRSHPA